MSGKGKGRSLKEEVSEETMEENSNETASVEELKKQIEELQRIVKGMAKSSRKKDGDEESEKLPMQNYVKVMSLTPNILNLSTEGHGRGKVFTFRKFGEVKKILYNDLVLILEAHHNFLEQGLFYILNKEVIQSHGLAEIYEHILPIDTIQKIINGDNQTDAVNFFASATDTQQDTICGMFIKKIFDGETVDLNLTDRLSRIVQKRKPDFDIRKKAEEARAYSELK